MNQFDDTPPPDAMRGEVVRTLRRRGVVRRPLGLRVATATAAALALVLVGAMLGSRLAGAPADGPALAETSSRYLLLLYEDEEFRASDTHVEEYREWAGSLAEKGLLEIGEKLAEEMYALESGFEETSSLRPFDAPTGLFLFRAASLDEALETARECPHLKYGGRVVVREVDET